MLGLETQKYSCVHTTFGATHVGHRVTNQVQNGFRTCLDRIDLGNEVCQLRCHPMTSSVHTLVYAFILVIFEIFERMLWYVAHSFLYPRKCSVQYRREKKRPRRSRRARRCCLHGAKKQPTLTSEACVTTPDVTTTGSILAPTRTHVRAHKPAALSSNVVLLGYHFRVFIVDCVRTRHEPGL
jgi:hypothetical protein